MKDDVFAERREAMVREQIAARGICNPAVLDAMRRVPRERFVATELRDRAYEDSPLSIAEGQTISQPYIVALMLEAAQLQPGDRVLEVGAGSGYACAVASLIAARVYAIERHANLAVQARERLATLCRSNLEICSGDGSAGWPEAAPFDAILVSAGGPRVPEALRRQLAIGGRLVMPVGDTTAFQRLVRVTRQTASDFIEVDLAGVAFVPLIGEHGWAPTEAE
jgi:protein-L-isoaspartate(D-aspartate) O-methyltransferase